MYDQQVQIHKTVLMQRLLDAVSRGYRWYATGTIPLHKAQRLVNKFVERYAIDRNENQRAYARRKGRANTRLFFYYREGETVLVWWLMVTRGEGRIYEEEKLLDSHCRRERLRIKDEYELLRINKPREKGGGTVWTWRMTQQNYERWTVWIKTACRYPTLRNIRPLVGSLFRTPGFSGIRLQVGHLVDKMRREWRRRHGSLEGLPLPPKLGYVERLPNDTVSLSSLV